MSVAPSEYFKSLPKRRAGAGALLLDGSGDFTVERLARRIRFAGLALQEGSTVELTNGVRAT